MEIAEWRWAGKYTVGGSSGSKQKDRSWNCCQINETSISREEQERMEEERKTNGKYMNMGKYRNNNTNEDEKVKKQLQT